MILKTLYTEDPNTVQYVLYPEISNDEVIIKKIASGVTSINPDITTFLSQFGEDPTKGFVISVKL